MKVVLWSAVAVVVVACPTVEPADGGTTIASFVTLPSTAQPGVEVRRCWDVVGVATHPDVYSCSLPGTWRVTCGTR